MSYEDEIYNFLTEEDNMKGLLDAQRHWPMIQERLRKEFYDGAVAFLKEVKATVLNQWEVYAEEAFNTKFSKIGLIPKDLPLEDNGLPSIMLGWEGLAYGPAFLGLWINLGSSNEKCYRDFRDQNKEKLKEAKNDLGWLNTDDAWWLYFKRVKQIDYSTPDFYLQLIPAKRNQLINALWMNLQELIPEAEVAVEQFKKMGD